MKYFWAVLPMIIGSEVVSLVCLCIMVVFVICDLAKAAAKKGV